MNIPKFSYNAANDNWLNTSDHDVTFEELESLHKKSGRKGRAKLREFGYVLTPEEQEVKNALLSSFLGGNSPEGKRNLRDMANSMNKEVKPMLKRSNRELRKMPLDFSNNVNIISMDFPEKKGAIQQIIKRNVKR